MIEFEKNLFPYKIFFSIANKEWKIEGSIRDK